MSQYTLSSRSLLVTQGDPAGIGLDITLKAWAQRDALALPPFTLLATPDYVRERAHKLKIDVPLAINATHPNFNTHLPIIALKSTSHDAPKCHAGTPDLAHASAIIEAIETGVEQILKGQARALITNPIAKYVLAQSGFVHAGHTEFLAALCSNKDEAITPVMMIWSEQLAVVPLTIHVALERVPSLITHEALLKAARIIHHDMRMRFGIERPHIAVAGLNPHAGEYGYIGTEDDHIIRPAIVQLRSEGLLITGPHSADTLFHQAAREHYDVALCMYHDQALIPVKTLCFDTGVNVTLGLPIIRTSPDHGTAFDKAGTGLANPSSFIEAVRLAHRLSKS